MNNERDSNTIGNKKRKNSVTSDLGVDNDVQLAVKDHPKKKKSKVLGDIIEGDESKSSRKEKKKKDRSKKDENAQGDEKKDKTGGKRSPFSELIVSEIREEGHQKKKKNKIESHGKKNLIDKVSDVNSAENHTPLEVNETYRPVNNKKKKKVKKFVDTSIIALSGNVGEDDQIGGESRHENMKKKKKNKVEKWKDNEFVGENKSDRVKPVKVPKQKKKKDLGDGDVNVISDVVESGVNSSKRNKESSKSKTEDIESNSVNDVIDQINDEVIKEKKRKKKNRKKEDDILLDGKKKKRKSLMINNEDDDANVDNNKRNEDTEPCENSTSSKKSKKVQFSENVEVFPLEESSSKGKKKKKKVKDGNNDNKIKSKDGLIRGKRFSKEEDEVLREAVLKYIEDHQLGEEGISMMMKSKSHPEIRGCWKEINEVLPHRPRESVCYRAHVLFERRETRTWTKEELELVKKFYEKHGPNWRALADELGNHRLYVKDLWRRNRLPNMKKGNWSQDEYQNLFNLVNVDLSMKTFLEKKSKHGMLRDNICWEVISEQLSTRSSPVCCVKWYNQLMSPMVSEGLWANADDYRLLIALSEVDASCEEDVDWDNLLEHRSGDICRRRWSQMVRHIGEYGTKAFSEQVDVLSQRYCPNLLDARESYDNQTPVD